MESSLQPDTLEFVDDHVLVQEFQNGDPSTFEELHRRHDRRLFGIAMSILKREELALDCLQETWISIERNLKNFTYKNGNAFRAWSARVASSRALNIIRTERIRTCSPLDGNDVLDEDKDLETSLILEEEREKKRAELGACIAELNEGQKKVVELRLDGKSYNEIADALGVKIGTVCSRVYRAEKEIRAMLSEKLRV